jgi:hypothetical protein
LTGARVAVMSNSPESSRSANRLVRDDAAIAPSSLIRARSFRTNLR